MKYQRRLPLPSNNYRITDTLLPNYGPGFPECVSDESAKRKDLQNQMEFLSLKMEISKKKVWNKRSVRHILV